MTVRVGTRRQRMRAAVVAGSVAAFALSQLPVPSALAAGPGARLVVYGPGRAVALGSEFAVVASVKGATGTPVYEFLLGHRVVQVYSTVDFHLFANLRPGRYTVVVKELGLGQFYRRELQAAKVARVVVNVRGAPLPYLTVKGPPGGVAKNGRAVISALMEHAIGMPEYRFALNGHAVRRFSPKADLVLAGLKPGTYQVQVKGLGAKAVRRHEWGLAQSRTLTLTVPPYQTVTAAVYSLAWGTAPTLITGSSSPTPLTVKALSRGGKPLRHVLVKVASANSNIVAIRPTQAYTAKDGQATFQLRPGIVGSVVLTARAGKRSASTVVEVTSSIGP